MSQAPKQLARINLGSIIKHPNPQIDLQIPIYEASTLSFMKALTTHKRRVLSQHNERLDHLNSEIRRAVEKSNAQEVSIRKYKIREVELKLQLQREEQERRDGEVVVLTLQRQLACLKESISSIQSEYECRLQQVEDLRREATTELAVAKASRQEHVDLAGLMERTLGLSIQGFSNQDKRLMICFHKLDRANPEQEVFFVLDSSLVGSGGPYRVLCSSPNLPSMALLVTALNDSHDLNEFVKTCRVEYVKIREKM